MNYAIEIKHSHHDDHYTAQDHSVSEHEEIIPISYDATPSSYDFGHDTHGLPSDVKDMCTGHSLCVVAFLGQNSYRDNQLMALHSAATYWNEHDVKFFWVESGEYGDCEHLLNLNY